MNQYTLTLKEFRDVAAGTRLFIFDKPADFTFQAGQYVALILPKLIKPDTRGPARTFSLSSAPYENEIHFTMRSGESAFKKTFWAMRPGDTVSVTKPVGFFVLPEDKTKEVVFLAGGIGITPVWSMLKQAVHEGDTRKMTLFYSNRYEKDVAFHEEIQNFHLPGLCYISVLSKSEAPCREVNDERGYICEDMLKKYLADVNDKLFYIVGSLEFITAMESMLIGMGVAKENMKKDPFTGLRTQLQFGKPSSA